jgi:excisionase family DNA binding protein
MKPNSQTLPDHANLTPREIAAFLRVSLSTIYESLNAHDIPSVRIRHQIRIPRDHFLEWYKKRANSF